MLTKSHIRKIAIDILTLRGLKVWKQNNIAVRGRKFIGEYGVGDVIGWHKKTGVFCGCEVKTLSDTLSNDQITWLTNLTNAGGIALIATEQSAQVVLIEFKEYVATLKK